jgi:vanillate O-demethylase monooxygenase subunit
MIVRNCWYVAAWDHEVAEGATFAITIADEPIMLFRGEGRLVALEDRCCHRFAPLSLGRVEPGCTIRCLYHGLKFDASGKCIEIPGQDRIPETASVRTYPVEQRHSWIWVWLGDPAQADPALIPPAVGLDDPRYVLRAGRLDYEADYQLINDNLTDFSHLAYVHADSFGALEAWAKIRPSVRRIDRGIRVSRWLPAEAALRDGKAVGLGEAAEPTAMWQTYDFLAPGILLMFTASYPQSALPEDLITPPTTEPLSANFTSQAVTPLGERKTRYFFSWGPRRIDGGDSVADAMFAVAERAFAEDKLIIEAQQRIMLLRPGQEMLTTADVGPVQMRSILRQLARAEADEVPVADAAE